ncbi:MAG: alpha/beta fold hydrolase [Candidatus Dormibacteria bacterium]
MSAAEEHAVDLGVLRLSVREHRGGAPPLLALHGLASNARWWDLVAEQLAGAYRVIAVDQRGHGRSDRPDSGYEFDDVVADLHGLVGRLELPPAVVVGHSWGASVALAYAAAHSGATLGVICVDGGFLRVRDHFGDSWDLAAVAMRPPEMHGLTRERIHQWIAGSALAEGSDPDTAAEIMLGNLEAGDSTGEFRPRLHVDRHMQIAHALWREDPDALLRAQRKPVLLVPAGGDGALRQAKEGAVTLALAALGDRGHVRWVEGGHDIPVQRPAQVAAAIADFVAGLAAVASPV